VSDPTSVSSVSPPGWGEFGDRQQNTSFDQFSWWAAAEATDGWAAFFAIRRDGPEIAPEAMILTRRMTPSRPLVCAATTDKCRERRFPDDRCVIPVTHSSAGSRRPPARHRLVAGYSNEGRFDPTASELKPCETVFDVRFPHQLTFTFRQNGMISCHRKTATAADTLDAN
jgi:hypothetical protein